MSRRHSISRPWAAFTLIELLVVVTIIVVLMALLVPALDRVMYQAKLVQCGATQKALASTMQFYAMDHRRFYPSNTDRRHTSGKYDPSIIGQGSDPARDLRPILLPDYVTSYKMLLCPLIPGQISLAPEDNDPASLVYASYFLFAGWQYPPHPGEYNGGSGMFKVGDRLEFQDMTTMDEEVASVILMDRNITGHEPRGWPTNRYQGSHPSRAFELREKTRVNQLANDMDPAGDRGTYSIWITGAVPRPIPIDINAAHSDGSVRRYPEVERWSPGFRGAQLHANRDHIDRSAQAYIPIY